MGKHFNSIYHAIWSDDLWKSSWFSVPEERHISLNPHMLEECIPKQRIIQSPVLNVYCFICARLKYLYLSPQQNKTLLLF